MFFFIIIDFFSLFYAVMLLFRDIVCVFLQYIFSNVIFIFQRLLYIFINILFKKFFYYLVYLNIFHHMNITAKFQQ